MVSLIVGLILASPTQSVVLCGDIMLNGISTKQKPFEKIAPILKPAGAVIANLEIPLTDAKGQTPNKSSSDVQARSQFILKADPKHAPSIAAAGIDMVSLGNNHCMDYRLAGLTQMQAALTKNNICFAGAGATRDAALALSVYRAADGRRIGLISALAFMGDGALGHCTPATEKSAGVATFRFGGVIDKRARNQLTAMFTSAKTQCDLLIVGLHWGIEKQTSPTQYQVELGRACIDSGADIVWGNHPHVLQGAELYKGKPILYSMGNFISSKGGPTGVIKLVYDSGTFQRAQIFPCEIGNGQVRPLVGTAARAGVKAFAGLCNIVQKRYPSKESVPLIK